MRSFKTSLPKATCVAFALAMLVSSAVHSGQVKATTNLKKWVVSPTSFFPVGTWITGTFIDTIPSEADKAGNWRGFKGTTIASDLAIRKIDTVVTRIDQSVPADSPKQHSVRSVLNEADKYGLKIIMSMEGLINQMRSMPHDQLMTEGKAKIEPFVREAMKHKSLIAYYLVDEPMDEAGYRYAADLKQIFNELDPSRFSFTAGVWPKLNIKSMLKRVSLPVAMPESYPNYGRPYNVGVGDFRYVYFTDDWYTWEGSKTDAYDHKYIKDLTEAYDALQNSIDDKTVLWPLVAAFQYRYDAPAWDFRMTTPEETRCMTGIALAKGAKGIFTFAYCVLGEYGDYPTMIPELESQANRLHKIGPILLKCERFKMTKKTSGGGSQYYDAGLSETFKGKDGSLYLIIVNRNCVPNPQKNPVKVTLDIPSGVKLGRIYDVENRVTIESKRTEPGKLQVCAKLATGDYALIRLGVIRAK